MAKHNRPIVYQIRESANTRTVLLTILFKSIADIRHRYRTEKVLTSIPIFRYRYWQFQFLLRCTIKHLRTRTTKTAYGAVHAATLGQEHNQIYSVQDRD